MSFSTFDHKCMASALQLARLGLETTHPNPRVGCVITRDGQVVGKGWHKKAGDAMQKLMPCVMRATMWRVEPLM